MKTKSQKTSANIQFISIPNNILIVGEIKASAENESNEIHGR